MSGTTRTHQPPLQAAQRLRILVMGTLTWFFLVASAQSDRMLQVPTAFVEVTSDAVTVQAYGDALAYQYGVGWSDGRDDPAPVLTEVGRVTITASILADMGIPFVRDVRVGRDGATTRLVLELSGVPRDALVAAEGQRVLVRNDPWSLELPAMAIPSNAPLLTTDTVRVAFPAEEAGPWTRLSIDGQGVAVRSFSLAEPTRLVIDIEPDVEGAGRPMPPTDAPLPGPAANASVRQLSVGVHYRAFDVPTRRGSSRVHVIDLDPRDVRLELATAREGATVPAMAPDAIAAINAGYFDPATFTPIGLRTLDGALVTSPSRNRAVVGSSALGIVVERAGARAELRVDDAAPLMFDLAGQGPISWSRLPGTLAGGRRVGVLVVDARGRVTRNGVGPAVVPDGGLVVSYDPSLRSLALVNPGQRVTLTSALMPTTLAQSDWAVEAGPLLVTGGALAFTPELEGFARGVRILDAVTHQAGLGVTPDGRVLFVVADTMVAEEFAKLFVALGVDRALRLDSGSSATLVANGRTVNRVVTRRVESAIVAYPSTLTEAER